MKSYSIVLNILLISLGYLAAYTAALLAIIKFDWFLLVFAVCLLGVTLAHNYWLGNQIGEAE